MVVIAFAAGAAGGGLVAILLGDSDDGSTGQAGAQAIADTAEAALPAVVTVINEITPSAENPSGGVGGGAGFIIDDRGFVLTNAHIVTIPGRLTVILHNGETRPAQIVSHDAPFTDLAVLRVQGGGLRALRFGDSESLRQGETVMALGSPDIDYRNSVSTGIVSGLDRRKRLENLWLEDLVQFDAAINVGNSGGPLIDLQGRVVGMVTFRDIGQDEPLFGISFALSSNSIRPIAQAIIDRGSFPRPYFGVEHVDIDDSLTPTAAAPRTGAIVTRVIGGSPAQAAGLRAGDVLLRIGRTAIDDQHTFLNALALVGASERVPVHYWREGRELDATVETTAR
jgi:2-alkenal reductase